MVKLRTMHTSNPLWGELDDPSHMDKANLSQADKELLSRIPRPLSLEGPRIHQPRIDLMSAGIKKEKQDNSLSLNENYVTHGVQLLRYINDLNKIKESALARRERGLPPLGDQVQSIPPLPPLSPPNSFPVSRTPFMQSTSLNHHHHHKSSSTTSLNMPPPLPALVHSHQAHKSLKKAVAALSAFHGYESSSDQALDVLTDATSQFLTKFCTLLRHARDRELLTSSNNGFPDIICRVYREMQTNQAAGSSSSNSPTNNSILDIRTYYKNAIIAKHKAIGETAEALAFECHHLDEVGMQHNFVHHHTMHHHVQENGSTMLPFSMLEDSDNIPEIHFPSSEEGDNGSSGPPTLSLDHNAPQIETT